MSKSSANPSGNFFNRLLSGRINRKIYALGIIFLLVLKEAISRIVTILEPFGDQYTVIALSLVIFVVIANVMIAVLFISFVIKRFHDTGHAGIEAVLLIVPFINIYYFFWLLFKKGEPRPNRHGSEPKGFDVKVFIGQ